MTPAQMADYQHKKTVVEERLAKSTGTLTLPEVMALRGMVIDVDKYEQELQEQRMHKLIRRSGYRQAALDLLKAIVLTVVGMGAVYVLCSYRVNLYIF